MKGLDWFDWNKNLDCLYYYSLMDAKIVAGEWLSNDYRVYLNYVIYVIKLFAKFEAKCKSIALMGCIVILIGRVAHAYSL